MKVRGADPQGPVILPERDAAFRSARGGALFASDLTASETRQSTEQMGRLLEEIIAQGKRLAATPTYSELKAYRERIRNFLAETVNRSYALQSQSGWDRHGRQKLYTTITRIDQTLAGLAEDVRAGQEKQLAILDKLDAIRGMLVDLYS